MPVLPNSVLPGNTTTGSVGNQIWQAAESSLLGSVGLSQASTRVNVAGMYRYSDRTVGPSPQITYPNASADWRVRLSLPNASPFFYNDPQNSLLSPLVTEYGGGAVNNVASIAGNLFGLGGNQRVGVIFPYTPQVQIQHVASYSHQKLVHNNYTQYFYENSEIQPISLVGEFTVQNIPEGQYLLACIYFFRSVTKMFFGADSVNGNAGNPPPILYLNGYGQYYLPNVPVAVTSFSHTMPDNVDYMDIPEPYVAGPTSTINGNPQSKSFRLNSTRMPTTSTISLSLLPMYSRTAQSQGFSLQDFASGALVNPTGRGMPATQFGASQGKRYAKGNINGGFL